MNASDVPAHQLIRSKRKTLTLVIDRNGELIVRAPLRMPKRDIDTFIAQKQTWIQAKQQQVKEAGARYQTLALASGEQLPYLGEMVTLKREGSSRISLSGATLHIPENATNAALCAWLKRQARTVITDRVQHFAALMNLEYTAIKMSGAQGRWGSCSAKNSLNFSWRLIMCPMEIIDYVVVHELSHVNHKNHSAQFWALVSTVLPDCKQRRAWLKTNRKILELP